MSDVEAGDDSHFARGGSFKCPVRGVEQIAQRPVVGFFDRLVQLPRDPVAVWARLLVVVYLEEGPGPAALGRRPDIFLGDYAVRVLELLQLCDDSRLWGQT